MHWDLFNTASNKIESTPFHKLLYPDLYILSRRKTNRNMNHIIRKLKYSVVALNTYDTRKIKISFTKRKLYDYVSIISFQFHWYSFTVLSTEKKTFKLLHKISWQLICFFYQHGYLQWDRMKRKAEKQIAITVLCAYIVHKLNIKINPIQFPSVWAD